MKRSRFTEEQIIGVLRDMDAGTASCAGERPRVERVLARLKPRHRQVFVLYEWEELSLEEVAQALDCPLETVRSRLRRARAEFRRLRRQELLRGGER